MLGWYRAKTNYGKYTINRACYIYIQYFPSLFGTIGESGGQDKRKALATHYCKGLFKNVIYSHMVQMVIKVC